MNLEGLLKELILKFREKFSDKRKVGDYGYNNLGNLNPPVQVNVLWVFHKKQNLQLMVFDHDEKKNDCEINIRGPYDLYKQIDELELCFINKSLFTLYESDFLNFIENINYDHPPYCGSRSVSGEKNGFIWRYFNLQEQNTDEVFDTIYKSPLILEKISSKAKPSAKIEKVKLKGYAIEIDPSIWIGEFPKPTFKEKLFRTSLIKYIKKVIDTTYKGKRLIIKNNGFIAIIEEDREIALKNLNEILSLMVITGIDIHSGKDIHVIDYSMDDNSNGESMSYGSQKSDYLIYREYKDFLPITKFNFEFGSPKIPINLMEKIVKQAEMITNEPILSSFCRILLDSYSHFKRSEYSQSFILSWALIEQITNKLLQELIETKGLDRNREKKLHRWTLDLKIENLTLFGVIDENEYREIMNLKSKRNKFIHNLNPICMDDAEKALELLKNLAKIMNKHLLPKFILNENND